MSEKTIKGFRDISGDEARKRQRIREIIVRNLELYGFEPAETPIIEYEDFVKSGNEQDEAVSDIFKLRDKGKRKLALRYEFTFQLKRLVENKKLPYKRYQIGEVFRDEPVSSNRFRQFTQCDVDVVGSTIKDEAEILALASRVLNELDISFEINVNNRRLMNEILGKEGVSEKDKKSVIREIDKLDKLGESEVRKNLKKYEAEKILKIFKKPESYFKRYEAYKEIEELKKYCRVFGVEVNFQPSLARGLSYYNASIFEIKGRRMKETICAGGSYLVNTIQSTGFSFGLDRLASLAKIDYRERMVMVVSIGRDKDAIRLAERLRDNNINVNLWIGKGISKALEYANSKGLGYVIFVGEEELKKGKFKLRDMKTGKQEMLNKARIVKRLKIV